MTGEYITRLLLYLLLNDSLCSQVLLVRRFFDVETNYADIEWRKPPKWASDGSTLKLAVNFINSFSWKPLERRIDMGVISWLRIQASISKSSY